MRQPLIAANWKMYKTPRETEAFLQAFQAPEPTGAEVVLFPAMTSLGAAVAAARETGLKIGAQNMHWQEAGAYTGETSAPMLTAVGCTHVLVGHSERREYFNETDTTVNLKLKAALTHGLVPIVCVGEHLEEREKELTEEVLKLQVGIALEGLTAELAAPIVFAYEPVWAIGTGRTATPEIAEKAHIVIRESIAAALGGQIADGTRILYGGSVKPDNAGALCCLHDVDGALVGGASLDPESFRAIVRNASGKSS